MNNNVVNALAAYGKSVESAWDSIRKTFGITNEKEKRRVMDLVFKGYSTEESRAIVKLENDIAITDSEFKTFVDLVNRIGASES